MRVISSIPSTLFTVSGCSLTHGFTGVTPFIRDSLPAMSGVRRGRRAPQPVLQMLSTFRMRSMGQLVPACRENPATRKPIHPRPNPWSSGHRDKSPNLRYLQHRRRHASGYPPPRYGPLSTPPAAARANRRFREAPPPLSTAPSHPISS
jgi:hypothetical protein